MCILHCIIFYDLISVSQLDDFFFDSKNQMLNTVFIVFSIILYFLLYFLLY